MCLTDIFLTGPLFSYRTYQGLVDVVRAVIDMGGDVNAGSNDGITALILACQAGHLPVVNTLIDAGAVVADPKSPFQPFPVAEEAGHVDVP